MSYIFLVVVVAAALFVEMFGLQNVVKSCFASKNKITKKKKLLNINGRSSNAH